FFQNGYGMIRFGNGAVGFFHKIRLPRFAPLPLFYPIQLAETKVISSSRKRSKNFVQLAIAIVCA
ncbi:MAG: hypothetical protein MUO77_17825, partial [Anaerolineales bacterium]|nr:hypothetical protein [Anaerolineales bacterium]